MTREFLTRSWSGLLAMSHEGSQLSITSVQSDFILSIYFGSSTSSSPRPCLVISDALSVHDCPGSSHLAHPVSDPLVSWRQLQPTVQTVGKSGTCRGSTTPLFPARSSHGARNTRLTSAAVMPSFLLPPSSLLPPFSCPERTFLKVRASEHGQAQSQCTRLIDKTRQAQSQHSETRRACSLFLASQSSFLFLRHFPLDKARVVQGSTRSLPTHGKAPLPSLSAERVGSRRGSLVRYMRDGNERKDRNCARAVCSS
mgnify:CR=1 FL=1